MFLSVVLYFKKKCSALSHKTNKRTPYDSAPVDGVMLLPYELYSEVVHMIMESDNYIYRRKDGNIHVWNFKTESWNVVKAIKAG